MTEKVQITVSDCEELYALLLREVSPNASKLFLWKELWRRLMSKLGYGSDDLMFPLTDPSELDTDENKIVAIQREVYSILEKHSKEPHSCMKVFDRINTESE